jgi:hypothetical protein
MTRTGDSEYALLVLDAASHPPRPPLFFMPPPNEKRCAALDGFSLHAATRVRARCKGLMKVFVCLLSGNYISPSTTAT